VRAASAGVFHTEQIQINMRDEPVGELTMKQKINIIKAVRNNMKKRDEKYLSAIVQKKRRVYG
jgi:hypothetical protein